MTNSAEVQLPSLGWDMRELANSDTSLLVHLVINLVHPATAAAGTVGTPPDGHNAHRVVEHVTHHFV
jgi:hypothetical protein